jgi:hypothetical protein
MEMAQQRPWEEVHGISISRNEITISEILDQTENVNRIPMRELFRAKIALQFPECQILIKGKVIFIISN